MITERAIQLVADAKVKQAYADGKFDRLPGFGRPFEFDDTAYDPHWWIRRKVEIEAIKLNAVAAYRFDKCSR
jgi:hypothetical protein